MKDEHFKQNSLENNLVNSLFFLQISRDRYNILIVLVHYSQVKLSSPATLISILLPFQNKSLITERLEMLRVVSIFLFFFPFWRGQVDIW